MSNNLSEEALEVATIEHFEELGYSSMNCYTESFGDDATLGRQTSSEVVLPLRLKDALVKLNPEIPIDGINFAIEELSKDRSVQNPVTANQEVYKLIKDGVKVSFKDDDGIETEDVVRVIDWDEPANNDFLITRQFKISGEMYNCRADLVLFVNGLPLVLGELKSSHKRLENGFNDNIKHYKQAIPQLFWYNAFIIVSNGSKSKMGTITSEWEHYSEWKKINSEGEKGIISLDTLMKGTCTRENLLDLIENFTLFKEGKGGNQKIVAKNHQFLGVNEAIKSVKDRKRLEGRLGVFWHTQGSGKSFSMVFFSQKVLRKLQGNWTFLIVTDREDLDSQICKNFTSTGAVTEEDVRAKDRKHLKDLLSEDHRNIFTMIQKFGTEEKGQVYDKLSDRDDIIVITDESHRSQYATLAMNMRKALPNASYIAFTGTPLMKNDEKTREVFGDYVSVYNFKQSIEDMATVPLFYENRIPELQIVNDNLQEDIQKVIDEAGLDEKQEEKFAREYVNMYQLITREGRLDKIAEDVVEHFMARGHMGKAMYIAIDKATAIKMHDKVKHSWGEYIKKLEAKLKTCSDEHKAVIQEKIDYMNETDMAVVVSSGQNEIEVMSKKGVDIAPHRKRMSKEKLDEKFKDTNSSLRIVFVCAMWVTGFDAPSVSTLYLDKLLKDHTLMQTIARANRVFKGKSNGLIVDYIGIFKCLQKALAIYGGATVENDPDDFDPVAEKAKLIAMLQDASNKMEAYCKSKNIDVEEIFIEKDNFKKIKLCDDAVESILDNEQSQKDFIGYANNLKKVFKAVLPDVAAEGYQKQVLIISILLERVNMEINEPVDKSDIEALAEQVEEILNESITINDYEIQQSRLFDISKVDFDELRERFFKQDKQKTLVERLKASLSIKIEAMLAKNKHRLEYLEKFEQLIADYNSGDIDLEQLFLELVKLARSLDQEEQRHMQENLTEEELVIFDILTKPEPKLSKKEIDIVKEAAKELIATLKKEKLVLDWKKRQFARAKVRQSIEEICDKKLPEVYDVDLFEKKCSAIYEHIYDCYQDAQVNIYSDIA